MKAKLIVIFNNIIVFAKVYIKSNEIVNPKLLNK